MQMHGASSQLKAIMLVSYLDSKTADLIMPSLPEENWDYEHVKNLLIEQLGDNSMTALKKTQFMTIKLNRNESIEEFSVRFYHEAQVLKGTRNLSVHDTHISLGQALAPYPDFARVMHPVLNNQSDARTLTNYMKGTAKLFPNFNKEKSSNSERRIKLTKLPSRQEYKPSSFSSQNHPQQSNWKLNCTNCGRNNHLAKDFHLPKKTINVITKEDSRGSPSSGKAKAE